MSDKAVTDLARLIVSEMLDSPRLQQFLREMVLRTLTEQDVIRQACAARAFLSACFARNVPVWLEGDALRYKGELGSDLTAALLSCGDAVVEHLKREREITELTEARMRGREEAQAKEDAALWAEWQRCGGGDEPKKPAALNGAATKKVGTQ